MSLLKSSRTSPAVVPIVIALLSLVTSTLALSTRANADPTPSYFYLAIGASESLGFQPTPDTPHGVPTDEGYTDNLVTYEAARGITLDLTQVGCPGETTTTMLTGNDHCYGGVDTQLATAMNVLSEHQSEQGIVTIDIGFNNVRLCLRHHFVNEVCVKQQLHDVRSDLPLIVQSLKRTAGPDVTFVGLGHYDPYLAYELHGGGAIDFARERVRHQPTERRPSLRLLERERTDGRR